MTQRKRIIDEKEQGVKKARTDIDVSKLIIPDLRWRILQFLPPSVSAKVNQKFFFWDYKNLSAEVILYYITRDFNIETKLIFEFFHIEEISKITPDHKDKLVKLYSRLQDTRTMLHDNRMFNIASSLQYKLIHKKLIACMMNDVNLFKDFQPQEVYFWVYIALCVRAHNIIDILIEPITSANLPVNHLHEMRLAEPLKFSLSIGYACASLPINKHIDNIDPSLLASNKIWNERVDAAFINLEFSSVAAVEEGIKKYPQLLPSIITQLKVFFASQYNGIYRGQGLSYVEYLCTHKGRKIEEFIDINNVSFKLALLFKFACLQKAVTIIKFLSFYIKTSSQKRDISRHIFHLNDPELIKYVMKEMDFQKSDFDDKTFMASIECNNTYAVDLHIDAGVNINSTDLLRSILYAGSFVQYKKLTDKFPLPLTAIFYEVIKLCLERRAYRILEELLPMYLQFHLIRPFYINELYKIDGVYVLTNILFKSLPKLDPAKQEVIHILIKEQLSKVAQPILLSLFQENQLLKEAYGHLLKDDKVLSL